MDNQGKVMTVRGPIEPDQIGICSTHEHLLFDFLATYWEEPDTEEGRALADSPITLANRHKLNRNPFVIKENLQHSSVEDAIEELKDFKKAGGSTVVEVTPIANGRDPVGLKKISEATDVNILATTSYYVESGHPAYVAEKSIDELAAILIKDIREGIDGTGIRAGFMGDVGTTKDVTENERKALRAVARAHLATGVAIGVHCDPSAAAALTNVKILTEEGVKPNRIVMEHMDEHPDPEYHLRVAETGVYLEFDTWGSEFYYGPPYSVPEPRDVQRAECVKALIDHGYLNQLLLAQDVWLRQLMKKYGGEGYDSLFLYGIPRLKMLGVTGAQIQTMLLDNPKKVLPISL